VIHRPITRRTFLRSLALVAGSVGAGPVLAACQSAPPSTPQVVERVVTQVVEKPVDRVVTQVVEKPVDRVVTKEIIVTATPAPAAAPTPKGPVTVEFIYSSADDVSSPNGKWIHDQIDQFQKENALIKVKQTQMPWVGQREVLITRLVAGDAPDMAILHSNHAAEIGSAMKGLAAMEELDGWPAYKDIFVPGRLATVQSQGKHYGVPWFGIVFGTAAHKPTFAEVKQDFPKTWTQFRQAAKAVTIPRKRYGYGAAMGQGLDAAYRVYPFVLMNGGRFMNEDLSTFTFNDEPNIQALQLFLDLKADGSTVAGMESWTGANEADSFPTGLMVMAQGGPWIPLWEKDLAKLNDWELITLAKPDKVAGSAPSVTLSDDIMLSITQQAKAKAEAFKLIQYLQNEPKATERAIRPELIALPVVKAAFKDARWQKTWGSAAYEIMLGASEPWPYTPVLGEAQNIYALAVSKAFSGQMSAKQALDEGVQKAQALIKK
jgi:ABC-type glycerol-3-phosphate transport system substrate-binding protein